MLSSLSNLSAFALIAGFRFFRTIRTHATIQNKEKKLTAIMYFQYSNLFNKGADDTKKRGSKRESHCSLDIYLSDFTRSELSKQSTTVPFVLVNQTVMYLCSSQMGKVLIDKGPIPWVNVGKSVHIFISENMTLPSIKGQDKYKVYVSVLKVSSSKI